MVDLLWPTYDGSGDLAAIEAVPLATLPVTPVGKPFKPALRAEATRDVIAEALRDMPTVTGVRGLARGADETSFTEVHNRFALTWRLEVS